MRTPKSAKKAPKTKAKAAKLRAFAARPAESTVPATSSRRRILRQSRLQSRARAGSCVTRAGGWAAGERSYKREP
jgi:hypothetical protein